MRIHDTNDQYLHTTICLEGIKTARHAGKCVGASRGKIGVSVVLS